MSFAELFKKIVRSAYVLVFKGWSVFSPSVPVFKGPKGPPQPPQPPGPPHKIAHDPSHVPTGPNLVTNASFENGAFGAGTETLVSGSGIIISWHANPGALTSADARWIGASHAIFSNAAEGARFVDLTGGRAPGPSRILTQLFYDAGLGLQAGKSYEVSLELGVGPNNGPVTNFGPPVSASVRVFRPPEGLTETFVSNPVNPPQGSGVIWERFSFRFKIPSGFALKDNTILITGLAANRLLGVDNMAVRLLT